MYGMKKLFVLFLIFGLVFSVGTSIVIYPSSTSLITKEYEESFSGGQFELVYDGLNIPSLSSLHAFMHSGDFSEISLKNVESEQQEVMYLYDLLNASLDKEVTVYAPSQVKGTLKWFDTQFLALSTNNLISFYNLDDITNFNLPVTNFYKTIKTWKESLVLKGEHPKGSDTVTLKYFQSGLDWNIYYSLATKGGTKGTGVLEASAIITNSAEDYEDVELTLVAGLPHLLSSYYSYTYNYAEAKSSEGAVSDSFTTTVSPAGFWNYKLKEKIDLPQYEEKSYVLFSSNVPYEYKYIWDLGGYYSSDSVQKKYFVNNSDSFTWPAGTVRVFEDQEFAGEDSIGYTPKKEQVELFVSTVPEIVVSEDVLTDTDYNSDYSSIYTVSEKLTMKNKKEEKITLYIKGDYSGYSNFELVESSLQPILDGQKLQWAVELDPDEELEITFTYEYTY